MKRLIYTLLILLVLAPASSFAQRKKSYVIGFYNLENLFDTYHDEGKNDYEYLPDGANEWTDIKYEKKLANMAKVIRAMRDENNAYHAVLGVSEIENRHVLEDLVIQPDIADANFQIVHYDGPDRRGVDVGLLYDPSRMTLVESESIPYTFDSDIDFGMTAEEKDAFRTRDILMAHGVIDGEHFAFYVCHLPSRLGEKSGALRSRGGEIVYNHYQKLLKKYPGIKCVVMGDMNDNPTDDSMAVYLHGRETLDEMVPGDFFSPFLSMLKAGFSSLYYRGESNIYDCLLVSYNLARPASGTFGIIPVTKSRNYPRFLAKRKFVARMSAKRTFYGRIFVKPFMTNQSGQYKGTPFRTFSNGAFVGGYSDHYPTYIVIQK